MENLDAIFQSVIGFGLDNEHLTMSQIALRAAVVFSVTLLLVRLAKKRFMSQATAFDFILGDARLACEPHDYGNAPFLSGYGASITLIGMHWLL